MQTWGLLGRADSEILVALPFCWAGGSSGSWTGVPSSQRVVVLLRTDWASAVQSDSRKRSALAEHLVYKLGSHVLSKIILRVGLLLPSWLLTSHSMSGSFNTECCKRL